MGLLACLLGAERVELVRALVGVGGGPFVGGALALQAVLPLEFEARGAAVDVDEEVGEWAPRAEAVRPRI